MVGWWGQVTLSSRGTTEPPGTGGDGQDAGTAVGTHMRQHGAAFADLALEASFGLLLSQVSARTIRSTPFLIKLKHFL